MTSEAMNEAMTKWWESNPNLVVNVMNQDKNLVDMFNKIQELGKWSVESKLGLQTMKESLDAIKNQKKTVSTKDAAHV